jgi:hypothetical protein
VGKDLDVTPGASANAALSGLPVGVVTFTGAAYSTPCKQVTTNSIPDWVTEPVIANVATASPVSVSLVFRRNGRIDFNGDFVEDIGTVSLAPMPIPVSAFGYAIDRDGDVFILGGGLGSASATTTVQEYHTATDTWEVDTLHGGTLAPLPAPRAYGFNAGVLDGKVHAVGGWDDYQSYRSDHFVYDKHTNTWTSEAPIPNSPIGQFSAVISDALYVAGGWWGSYASTLYRFTEATGWTTLSSMPTPRNHATMGVVGSSLFAIGGESTSQLAVVEKFDTLTNTWSTGFAAMPTPHSFLGWCGSPSINGKIYTIANLVYDSTSNTWASMAPTLPDGIAAAVAYKGEIFAFGSTQTVEYVVP